MQIKKINNNKLKVILSLNDLDEKNIDVDSFLSNSIESQDLFFEILDLAQEQYDFNIENNKAIVEAISLDNNIFILTITKLKTDYSNTYNTKLKIYNFENSEDFLTFYSFAKRNKISLKDINFYEYNNRYYLVLNNNNFLLENFLLEYSDLESNSDILDNFLLEYGQKIKINLL